MKSTKPLLASAMMLLCVPLAGCVHTAIANDVPQCEKLIPPEWNEPVPPVDLPEPAVLEDGHDDAEPWQKGFIGQTGQLEKANDRSRDKGHIYRECLREHSEQLKKDNKGFFGRLFS